METQAKHTPTPYKACKSHEDFDGPYFDIEEEERAEYDARPYTSIDSASGLVCTAHDLFTFKPGDAEFIVKACNNYQEMRNLLARAMEELYTAGSSTVVDEIDRLLLSGYDRELDVYYNVAEGFEA